MIEDSTTTVIMWLSETQHIENSIFFQLRNGIGWVFVCNSSQAQKELSMAKILLFREMYGWLSEELEGTKNGLVMEGVGWRIQGSGGHGTWGRKNGGGLKIWIVGKKGRPQTG